MRKTIFITILLSLVSLSCGPNKKSAEYIAKQYLTALKNKDWETAKKYSTKETDMNLDLMKSLGANYSITEIKNIKCRKRDNQAICTFCCSEDTGFKQIYLIMMDDGQWFHHQPKIIDLWDF